jgi:branched-subunit amino acid ABC-type transport system permease component
VEDDPDIRAITRMALAELGGFELRTCSSGSGALRLAPLYLPSGIKHSVPFLLIIAILLVRPSGVLGRARRRKV